MEQYPPTHTKERAPAHPCRRLHLRRCSTTTLRAVGRVRHRLMTNFGKALDRVPLDGYRSVKDLHGPSYVYAILRDQIRNEIDVDDRAVTILECRPPSRADLGPEWTRFAIARLRYTKARREWHIYWRDR